MSALGSTPPPANRDRVCLVLNRESGAITQAGPEVLAEELRELFAARGCVPDVHLVPGKDIPAALDEAADGPADLIVVVVGGGDGTVASAAARLSGTGKTLGILPLGTFNLAARDVGMPLEWREAAEALFAAPAVDIDLIEVNGEPALCVVVLGFYPALQMGRGEYHGKWLVKAWRSARIIFSQYLAFPPLRLHFTDGGAAIRQRSRNVIIANNDYEDLFGLIPHRVRLDGGFFTVYIAKHRTRLAVLRSFAAWLIGRWKDDRELFHFQASSLEISVKGRRRLPVMRDGELARMDLPLRVRLRPKAVRVLAPRLAMPGSDAGS